MWAGHDLALQTFNRTHWNLLQDTRDSINAQKQTNHNELSQFTFAREPAKGGARNSDRSMSELGPGNVIRGELRPVYLPKATYR
jgi:hypothetical protein